MQRSLFHHLYLLARRTLQTLPLGLFHKRRWPKRSIDPIALQRTRLPRLILFPRRHKVHFQLRHRFHVSSRGVSVVGHHLPRFSARILFHLLHSTLQRSAVIGIAAHLDPHHDAVRALSHYLDVVAGRIASVGMLHLHRFVLALTHPHLLTPLRPGLCFSPVQILQCCFHPLFSFSCGSLFRRSLALVFLLVLRISHLPAQFLHDSLGLLQVLLQRLAPMHRSRSGL